MHDALTYSQNVGKLGGKSKVYIKKPNKAIGSSLRSLTEAPESASERVRTGVGVRLGQVHLVLPAGDVRLHHLHRVAVGLAERAEEGRLEAIV